MCSVLISLVMIQFFLQIGLSVTTLYNGYEFLDKYLTIITAGDLPFSDWLFKPSLSYGKLAKKKTRNLTHYVSASPISTKISKLIIVENLLSFSSLLNNKREILSGTECCHSRCIKVSLFTFVKMDLGTMGKQLVITTFLDWRIEKMKKWKNLDFSRL